MDVEQPLPTSSWTPISSPNVRSAVSGESSNSVGSSSLDTASASAHLERYDLPWSFTEIGRGLYRSQRARSYNAFLDWSSTTPNPRSHLKHARPLAGASRRRLIRQIQQLTKDKAELQAQLAALALSSPSSIVSLTTKEASSTSIPLLDGVDRMKTTDSVSSPIADGMDNVVPSSNSPNSFFSTEDGPGNPYPFMDGLVGYPSTLVGPEQTLEATSPSSLEHIAALASRLRMALETSTTDLLDEDDSAMLSRPGMRAILLKRKPNPERAQLYARFFAKRFIEMQKRPEARCAALRPGVLQQTVKHPAYVNILMSGLREPFIAHMGAFDETEFGLWILNGVEFHSEALSDTQIEVGELDDSCYEFSQDFFERFPFTGTKEMIANANRWRKERNEPPLEQTAEMAAAEAYTKSRQLRAKEKDGESSYSK